MRRARPVRVLLGSLALLTAWLFLGVYSDREWGDLHLFVKHRPSAQLFFHAPCGESDQAESSLPEELRRAERLYRDFVEAGGGWRRSVFLPWPY